MTLRRIYTFLSLVGDVNAWRSSDGAQWQDSQHGTYSWFDRRSVLLQNSVTPETSICRRVWDCSYNVIT